MRIDGTALPGCNTVLATQKGFKTKADMVVAGGDWTPGYETDR